LEDNIRMDLEETGWEAVDWTGFIWLRIMTTAVLS
jgi:hypothetical protein